jgi:psiF repeat
MTFFKTTAVAAILIAVGVTTAFAQTTPAPAPKAAAPATTAPAIAKTGEKKPKVAQAPRTAKSLACSAKATEQKLTGKPRKDFMKTCKKAA